MSAAERRSESIERNDPGITQRVVPKICDDYNQHMGGADRTDQLRSYHHNDSRNRKWTSAMFLFPLEQTVVNYWITLPKDVDKTITLVRFKENLIQSLCKLGKRTDLVDTSLENKPQNSNTHELHRCKRKFCQWSGCRKRTWYMCKSCNIPFCFEGSPNCYSIHIFSSSDQ